MSNHKNNLNNNPHLELPPPLQPQQLQRIYQQQHLEEQRLLTERQQQYEAQQMRYDEGRRQYEEQRRQLEEHQRQLQQKQTQLDEQRRQQEQQHIASVYPKLPSQEELPSYSVASSPIVSMPQPLPRQEQYTTLPPVQYPQYPQQSQSQSQPRAPLVYYGSMAPPNVTAPAIPQQQRPQENQVVQSIEVLKTQSELVQCPHCQQLVYTALDYDSGLCTGLSVGGLFLAGCHSGGCLIPFLFPWTKDVRHNCPSCMAKIATYKRLERNTEITVNPLTL